MHFSKSIWMCSIHTWLRWRAQGMGSLVHCTAGNSGGLISYHCVFSACSPLTAGPCFPWPVGLRLTHWLKYSKVLHGTFHVCWLFMHYYWGPREAIIRCSCPVQPPWRRQNSLANAATLLIQPSLRQPSEVTGFRLLSYRKSFSLYLVIYRGVYRILPQLKGGKSNKCHLLLSWQLSSTLKIEAGTLTH